MTSRKEAPSGAFDVVLTWVLERARTATFAGGFGAFGGGVSLVLAPAVTCGWMLLAAGGVLVAARLGQLVDRAVGL